MVELSPLAKVFLLLVEAAERKEKEGVVSGGKPAAADSTAANGNGNRHHTCTQADGQGGAR